MNVVQAPTAQSNLLRQVGVIGGGQLAQMMAEAAKSLKIELLIQTPDPSDPAVAFATDVILGEIVDATATAQLAKQCEVITFENEFVDLSALSILADQGVCFRPRLATLSILLDKYEQLCWLQTLGLPIPRFKALTPGVDLLSQIETWDFPLVLKARRHGYDGQGTWVVQEQAHLERVLTTFGSVPLLLQSYVPYERELAVIAARSATGEVAIYPIVETYQRNQVCHWAIVPANLPLGLLDTIENMTRLVLDGLQAVGIFAIELFLTSDGQVLINEIAPRTHNSGHFSLDACQTSQFEQHLRAVCNFPLGDPALISAGAIMVNLLGYEYAQDHYFVKRQQLAEIPGATVHWYGKAEARPGRKLGHITVLLQETSPESLQAEALAIAQQVETIWY
ncbi:MAG: 5-(carboxyamino)imidazole ribonucleotide synthase [Microcoleaceae cyanobacterium]